MTAEVPAGSRASVGLFCGLAAVLLCVTAAVAASRGQAVRGLKQRVAAAEAEAARRAAMLEAEASRRVAALEAEAAKLADETIPQAVKQLREGGSVDTVLASVPAPAGRAHARVFKTLAREIATGERMRASAMAACANAAGRVQALATSMLADLREMENRHDESVLGDLLKLDHTTAQAGRIADSIAVLTGARSGRRWTKPIVMESVLRGAVGRISAYQRVRIHSASTAAVAGYAAEGVMHALAELMDNAASFSPPTEEVHVYVQETHTGVVVTIEDGGLVMSPAALARAEKAVSAEALDLTKLSGTRLGLAVVGQLARKHNLTVSFRPSSRGGTGVVVLIPQQLIVHAGQDAM
ncbi:ATP-binding region ATPase domain-containing protein, partial [Streptomyces sparsogenes DSM 40356]